MPTLAKALFTAGCGLIESGCYGTGAFDPGLVRGMAPFADPIQRFWQPGQKKVERCACTTRRTVPPQRAQGKSARA